MGVIGREAIVAAQDLRTQDVPMPEWGGDVRVREMSAADLVGFWEACRTESGEILPSAVQPALLARTICDESGALLFSGEAIGELMAKGADPVARLFKVARELNGIGQEGTSAKNSEAGTPGASPSGSV